MNEQNVNEVSDFEDEETQVCKCATDMELICSDEGGTITYWCPECGTVLQVMDGEDEGEWKSPRK